MPSSGFLPQGICFSLLFTRNNVKVTREIKSCQCSTGNSRELFLADIMMSGNGFHPVLEAKGTGPGPHIHWLVLSLCFSSAQNSFTVTSYILQLSFSEVPLLMAVMRLYVFGGLSPEWHSAFLTATPTSSLCCHFALK